MFRSARFLGLIALLYSSCALMGQESELASLSPSELIAKLPEAPSVRQGLGKVHQEKLLREIIRRGGKAESKALREMLYRRERTLASVDNRRNELLEVQEIVGLRNGIRRPIPRLKEDFAQMALVRAKLMDNAGLFTAIRRLENMPDPLVVELLGDTDFLTVSPREPLKLSVAIANRDKHEQTVFFNETQKDRHGRNPHWRIGLVNGDGVPVDTLQRSDWEEGSGLTSAILRGRRVKAGDQWRCELELQHYVQVPMPGTYQLIVHYHSSAPIADLPADLVRNELITYKSKPFMLQVRPLAKTSILLSAQEHQDALAWIGQVQTSERIRYMLVKYSDKYEYFIKPNSPVGKLHLLGWKAVPALVERLERDHLAAAEKAWILALLYSLTQEYATEPFVKGETMSIHRHVEFAKQVKSGVELDAARHERLRKHWLYLREHCFDIEID